MKFMGRPMPLAGNRYQHHIALFLKIDLPHPFVDEVAVEGNIGRAFS